MSKWIEWKPKESEEFPNVEGNVRIRHLSGWESETYGSVRGWHWFNKNGNVLVTHYMVEEKEEIMSEEKKYIVVGPYNECWVEDSELEAITRIKNIIAGGYDSSEIQVYESVVVKSVQISLV